MAINFLSGRTGGVGGGGYGGGAYGGIPGPIGVPPNIYAQTAGVVPNLDKLSAGAGAVAGSELAGVLSPETIRNIQDQGAAWGIGAGMPGFTPGSLVQNRSLRNLGLQTEALQHQGIGDFLSTLTGIGGTMTNPALAAEIANRNSIFAAAPNPAAAAAELERQWLNRFNLTRGSGSTAPTWAQINSGGTPNIAGFGTGTANFLGGFDPGAGGPPEVAGGALGPFTTYGSPARGTGMFALTGNTYGGQSNTYDDVLREFLDPESYYFGGGGEDQTVRTSGGDLGI